MMMDKDKQDRIDRLVLDRGGELPPKLPDNGFYTYKGKIRYGYDQNVVCSESEFMEARKRLENKPTEWRGDWLAQTEDGRWWSFIKCEPKPGADGFWSSRNGLFENYGVGHVFGDWRQSLEPRPSSHPMNNEHHDHKEGEGVKWRPGVDLPPKGAKCMALVDADGIASDGEKAGRFKKGTYEGFCILPNSGWAYLFKGEFGHTFVIGQKELFDHYKSHRDKVIEAAQKATGVKQKFCGALYDAGMLKLPEGEE